MQLDIQIKNNSKKLERLLAQRKEQEQLDSVSAEQLELVFMNSLNDSDQEDMDEADSHILFEDNKEFEMSKHNSKQKFAEYRKQVQFLKDQQAKLLPRGPLILEQRILTEKRNEVFDYKQIDFTISKTPGTLNLEKFTFSEYNTKPQSNKFIRKCWQEPQKTYASETKELMEKVRKQR